jgi:hypothetical protein
MSAAEHTKAEHARAIDELADVLWHMGVVKHDRTAARALLVELANPDNRANLIRWLRDEVGLDMLLHGLVDTYGPEHVVYALFASVPDLDLRASAVGLANDAPVGMWAPRGH